MEDKTVVITYMDKELKSLHGIHEIKIVDKTIEVRGTICEEVFNENCKRISNPYDIKFLKITYKKEPQNMQIE
jgi:hypothetical protein